MFFGLTNAPATFQTIMDNIFSEELVAGWLKIYIDDIIIATANDLLEHQKKVAHVLQKLKAHNLYLKPEKCTFYSEMVDYLSVIIRKGEVCMDPVKVEGIKKWPIPSTIKELQSFLGFCNFY